MCLERVMERVREQNREEWKGGEIERGSERMARDGSRRRRKVVWTHLLNSLASFLLSTSRVRGLSGSASDTLVLLVLPIAAPVTASSLQNNTHRTTHFIQRSSI